MTKKEIMGAPARALARVENLRDELDILQGLATSISAGGETVRIGGEMHLVEKVNGTPAVMDRMAEKATAAADKAAELDAAIIDLDQAIRTASKLLEGLPPRQSRVLHMTYIQGMTIAEAADKLGVSYTTAAHDHKAARSELGI